MIGLERWERFIAARLDEDEQAARAASASSAAPWRLTVEQDDFDGDVLISYTVLRDAEGTPIADDRKDFTEEEVRHLARHEPARALREVEARRRTLARHTGQHVCPEPPDEFTTYQAGERVTYATPCGDLRDLAAAWADHPDHPERRDET